MSQPVRAPLRGSDRISGCGYTLGMTAIMNLVRYSFGKFAAAAFLCTSSFAQTASHVTNFSYKHGTCVVVAWRGQRMAVAADSRSVMSSFGSKIIQSNVCKLRPATPRILVSVVGLAAVNKLDGEVVWDGLNVAKQIFSNTSPKTQVAELLKKANRWEDSFDVQIQKGRIAPSIVVPGKEVVTLQVFARTGGKNIVIIARFGSENGVPIRREPTLARPPLPNETKTIPFGVCNGYLDSESSRIELIQSELLRYQQLSTVMKPTAISVENLRQVALGYVDLAGSVSARMATAGGSPATVGPPYTSATLDLNSHNWSLHPTEACNRR